jgi:HEPN domain-containing protein
MIDIKKQIEYWVGTAEDDLDAVKYLVENGKTLQAMFFCHLAVEKIIKAHVTKLTNDVPPKIHNLKRLAELAELILSNEQNNIINELMVFQQEGRYPEYYPEKPAIEVALIIYNNTKMLVTCLKQML